MTDQDQRFQHRWEFRRAENDVDSSSDDDHSRPSSASEPKVMKQKPVPCLNPEENTQQTIISPTSNAEEEKEHVSSFKEPNSKPKQAGKSRQKKAGTRNEKSTSDNEPACAASFDLAGHMKTLVEEIKVARKDLIAWMDNEMNSSSKADVVASKPSGAKKGQRQNTARSKAPRNNPRNRRKKADKVTQNGQGEPSGKRSSATNEEVVTASKETENAVNDKIPGEKPEKQKGKKSRLPAKKQKIAGVEADHQSNTTVAAAADNYLTLPNVLPQKQAENSERNPLEVGNEIDGEKRTTALDSGGSAGTHQLKFDPRAQQKDVVFAQNGMPRNVANYEQNTGNSVGNGNGNGNGNGSGFPFPLVPQGGSNGGIGMPNIPSQFGLQQYLSQGNRISGMYMDHPGFPNGNHAFMGGFGGMNQHLKYNFQQGEVMALQCPDIRRAAFNQGNIANQ